MLFITYLDQYLIAYQLQLLLQWNQFVIQLYILMEILLKKMSLLYYKYYFSRLHLYCFHHHIAQNLSQFHLVILMIIHSDCCLNIYIQTQYFK